MNRDLTEAERNTLEALVDATNLNAVLQGLSQVCSEKADHIQESYTGSDHEILLERRWREAEGAIGCLATDKHIMAVSL